jgi:hypothetical protein
MSQSVSPAQKSRSIVSARRLALLASAAVIGAGVLFSSGHFVPKSDSTFLQARPMRSPRSARSVSPTSSRR